MRIMMLLLNLQITTMNVIRPGCQIRFLHASKNPNIIIEFSLCITVTKICELEKSDCTEKRTICKWLCAIMCMFVIACTIAQNIIVFTFLLQIYFLCLFFCILFLICLRPHLKQLHWKQPHCFFVVVFNMIFN